MTDRDQQFGPSVGPGAEHGGFGLESGLPAPDPGAPVHDPSENEKPTSLWQDAWHDLRRRPVFLISGAVIILLIVISIAPGLFTGENPHRKGFCSLSRSLLPVSGDHPFGTDFQGCDVYTKAIYAARVSVSVGLLTTIFVTLVGATIGAVAAYYGGWIDAVLSRIADVFYAIPLLLGAFVILAVFPARNIPSIVFTLAVLAWPQLARIMRASVITVRDMDFVHAARALGATDARILRKHIVPNSIAPVIVVSTINLGVFITVEATLSFLGIGLVNTISWGTMIEDSRARFLTDPGPLLFPASFLFLTVLSFILIGDAVRDALDPKLR